MFTVHGLLSLGRDSIRAPSSNVDDIGLNKTDIGTNANNIATNTEDIATRSARCAPPISTKPEPLDVPPAAGTTTLHKCAAVLRIARIGFQNAVLNFAMCKAEKSEARTAGCPACSKRGERQQVSSPWSEKERQR